VNLSKHTPADLANLTSLFQSFIQIWDLGVASFTDGRFLQGFGFWCQVLVVEGTKQKMGEAQ